LRSCHRDPVRLVVLDPGIDVCKRRNAARDPAEQFSFNGYEWLKAEMRRGFGDVGWWFDTSAMTADETAGQLIAELAARARIIEPSWNAWLRHRHVDAKL
jgi:hypothetical protein